MFKLPLTTRLWLGLAGCITTSAFAQPPDTLWTRLYDVGENSGDMSTNRMTLTADSGFVLTVEGLGQFSGGLLKLSADGEEQWQRGYNYYDWNGGGFTFTAIHGELDGGLSVYGNICSTCLWGSGMGVIRTDANGDSLWSRHYFYFSNFGGLGHTNSSIWDAEPTLDGGRVIAGQIFIVVGQNQEYVNYAAVMKVTAAGDTVWVSRHDSASHFTDVDVISSGGFIAVGAGPRVSIEYPHDLLITRLTEDGSTVWSLSPGTGRAVANSVEETPNGGFVIAGYVEELNGAQNVRLFKLNSNGNLVWTQSDADSNLAAVYRLRRVSSGGYIALYTAFGLVRYDENGDSVWTRFYSPPENYYGSFGDVVETSDHGYAVVGATYTLGPFHDYVYLVRTLSDSTTIEAAPDVGGRLPNEITLLSFPNPFNPSTTIAFSLPRTSEMTLAVYDVTGRNVGTLIDKSMNAGEHTVSFDGSALASGLYFARLTAGDYSQTRKMVLLK